VGYWDEPWIEREATHLDPSKKVHTTGIDIPDEVIRGEDMIGEGEGSGEGEKEGGIHHSIVLPAMKY
jgi:hypothetical protein